MNKDEYLELLRIKLENEHAEDKDSVIAKCLSWFDICSEAGMTEEETISKIGDVDTFIKRIKTQQSDTVYDLTISLKTGIVDEIIIKNSNKTSFTIDDSISDYIEITNENNHITISDSDTNRFGFNLSLGSIEIEIDSNIRFENISIKAVSTDFIIGKLKTYNFRLNCVSSDLSIESLMGSDFSTKNVSGDTKIKEINAQNISLNTVSGDYHFDSIICENLTLKTVSGDFSSNTLKTNFMSFNTTSGDISSNVCEIEKVKGHTTSGDVTLKGNVKENNISSLSGEIRLN